MTGHLSFLLFLTGLTGIHSLTSVKKVSVIQSQPITIPCLYDSKYLDNVKYLCKGFSWVHCTYAVKTNENQTSEIYSVSDDKKQRTFSVTIKDLTSNYAGYWCGVEIDERRDTGYYFKLVTTQGTPSLYVDNQEITGDSIITINCYYSNSGEMRWCRLGRNCVTGSGGIIDGARVTINENVPNVFTVTMSGLTTVNSGWYYCVKGDLQMPVHLTVSGGVNTTTLTTATLTTDTQTTATQTTATQTTATQIKESQTVHSQSLSIHIKSFLIRLSVLIFIALVGLFSWFIFRRHKQNKEAESVTKSEEKSHK